MELRDFQRVGKLRHASQKCKHFFEGMQAAARTRFRSHTCGLGSVFSDVHAAGKHDLTLSRRLRTAELCEAPAAQSAEIHVPHRLACL